MRMLNIAFVGLVTFSAAVTTGRAPVDEERYTVVFRRDHSCATAAAITGRYGFYLDCASRTEGKSSVYAASRFGIERNLAKLEKLRGDQDVLAVSLAQPIPRQ